jgi:hypothetical protein
LRRKKQDIAQQQDFAHNTKHFSQNKTYCSS